MVVLAYEKLDECIAEMQSKWIQNRPFTSSCIYFTHKNTVYGALITVKWDPKSKWQTSSRAVLLQRQVRSRTPDYETFHTQRICTSKCKQTNYAKLLCVSDQCLAQIQRPIQQDEILQELKASGVAGWPDIKDDITDRISKYQA